MNADTEARQIVDAYCRAHDYTLITREQAARVADSAVVGAVPWSEHLRAIAKVEAELGAARARVVELEKVEHTVRAALAAGAVAHTWRAELFDALDAAPTAETTSGEIGPGSNAHGSEWSGYLSRGFLGPRDHS